LSGRPLIVIYGSLHGVGAKEKVQILLNSGLNIVHVFLHQPKNGRAMLLSELKTLFVAHGFFEQNLHELLAWSEVMDKAQQHSAAVVVCGSLYTVGEIRGQLLSIDMDNKTPDF
jgi:folylpolyglutamate synthase/dihydropteroate synthase